MRLFSKSISERGKLFRVLSTVCFALVTGGILGSFDGKVGGVVGAGWKGRRTMRGYAKPGNPKTAAQVTQRGLFSFVVSVGKLILTTVVQKFWNPFAGNLSGSNVFNRVNLNAIADDTDYDSIIMAQGNLEQAGFTSAVYVPGTGVITLTWDDTVIGNGLATDKVVFVIIDSGNNIAFVIDAADTRADSPLTPNIGIGRTVGELKAYMFLYRGTGANMEVSTSIFEQVA